MEGPPKVSNGLNPLKGVSRSTLTAPATQSSGGQAVLCQHATQSRARSMALPRATAKPVKNICNDGN